MRKLKMQPAHLKNLRADQPPVNKALHTDNLQIRSFPTPLPVAGEIGRCLPRFIVNAVLSESLIFPLDSKNDRNASNR